MDTRKPGSFLLCKQYMMFKLGIIIFFPVIGLALNEWVPVDSKCFHISSKSASHDKAVKICRGKKSSLYSIKDEHELQSLSPLFERNVQYWTAVRLTNNGYEWEDGRTCCPSNWWGRGEPKGRDKCARLKASSNEWLLFGKKCSSKNGFICVKDLVEAWTLVNRTGNYLGELCGVEIMPNCEGLACKDLCKSHPNCDTCAKIANLCVNMKNVSQTDNCVVKLRPNLEIHRLVNNCNF